MHLELVELYRRMQGRVTLPSLEITAEIMKRRAAEARPIPRFEDNPLDLTDLPLLVRMDTLKMLRATEVCGGEPAEYRPPIHEYSSSGGGDCAVTGGHVVRDRQLRGLRARYLYADFCRGSLRSFDPARPGSPAAAAHSSPRLSPTPGTAPPSSGRGPARTGTSAPPGFGRWVSRSRVWS